MKKFLSLLLCLGVIIAISACGRNSQKKLIDIYSNSDDTDTKIITGSDPTYSEENVQQSSMPVSTDWDSFECEYYGDLPIDLLTTPDATPDIVKRYINDKQGTSNTFEVKQIYNAYHSCQMTVEDVFSIHNCKGTATFLFDWKETLYEIDFEFDDSTVTPSIMKQVHDDIDGIVGGKCATNYLIDKGWNDKHDEIGNNSSCFCGWHLQDDLKYEARFSSYFHNNHSMENKIEFKRNNYNNKTNYDAVRNSNGVSDSITVNGVRISGQYHDASSPYVSGTATNNSSKTVRFIKIKIALKNSSGKVIDTVWTYAVGAEGLASGESTQWKVYCSEADGIVISVFN